MSIFDNCLVMCGYCEKPLGEQSLQTHFDSGECGFIETTYEPFTTLLAPLKDERVIDWLAA